MPFYGRTAEKTRIERELSRDRQSAILVYGRRRVGKSELIKHCLRSSNVTSVYYECRQTTEADNVRALSQLVSELFGYPAMAFDGIGDLLEFLFKRTLDGKPLVLVLDEYPYLRATVKGLDSIVQSLLDAYADTGRMKLIVCGSYIDVMRSLLEVQNPLYGRVDLTIDLKPMDYYDAAQFYGSFSDEDKVRLYSVFGGVPYYNRLIDASLSVRHNIIELVASPGARLENEVSMYLSSEIAKIGNANEVFGALSQGYTRYRDILDQSHVSSGPTLVDVLDKLVRMELVQKQAPINDPDNRKKAGYRIVDGLSLFYYRYVYRYASQLGFLDPEVFYDRYVQKDFEERYVPHAFEEVCRQYLVRKNRAGELEIPFDVIGRYYYDDPATKTNGEFDVVTRDPQGYALYEAKFRTSPVTDAMIDEEIAQVERTGLACYKYGFFSRSGFEVAPRPNLALIDLAELYA